MYWIIPSLMTKWALLFNLSSQSMFPRPWLSQQLDCFQFLHIHLELIPKVDEVLWAGHSHPRIGTITSSQSAGHASLNVVICLTCDKSAVLVCIKRHDLSSRAANQPIWFPACGNAWDFSSFNARLCTLLCWTSWCLLPQSSNLWPSPFEMKLCLLSCQTLLLI